MNREQITVAAALTVAALALLAALLMGGYLLRTLNRMQKLLRDYREKGSAAFQTMKETRESRLESSLERILQQAAGKEAAAERERDEVAALLSDLTHQLKTPMANVRMYTELLGDDTLSPGAAPPVCTAGKHTGGENAVAAGKYAESLAA